MLIAKSAVAEYLDRRFDSYLWMKKLPRREIVRALDDFRIRPLFKTDPWLHQLVCFYIGLCEPRFMFLLDMGLGKSKILLDLIRHAQREGKLEHALVGVPRLINVASWLDDVAQHSVLEPWPILIDDVETKWELLSNPKGDLTLIDYQGLTLAICKKEKNRLVRDDKKVEKLRRLYNWIGIDESHKLKNHENLWFSNMWQLTKRADYVYATTGTLFGRDVEDLFAQFKLVDRGDTFGENLGLFRRSFFTAKSNGFGTVRTFDKGMTRQLNRMINHRSVRYDNDEVQELPPKTNIVIRLDMGEEQREHYMRALEGLINARDGSPSEIDAPWLRMRQILSGYLKWKDSHGEHTIFFKHNPKLLALERLIDEKGDSKMVVCHDYRETGGLIHERLNELKIKHEWLYGGTKDKIGARRRFIDDPEVRVFLMNSEAGGTGTDGLQKVARYLAYFESPTPPITRRQTDMRVFRSGQEYRSFIYDLIFRRSVDQGILDDLAAGRDLYESVVKGRAFDKKKFLAG